MEKNILKRCFILRWTGLLMTLTWSFCLTGNALARNLPQGAVVQHGQVDFAIQGNTMQIEQGTPRAIVEWESFDIGDGFAVEVHQPSAQAAMLARVTGGMASEIHGRLTANGGFYLVNPHGVLFGNGAVVEVNRLMATTRQLADQDFLNGRMNFLGEATTTMVENHGVIQADNAVALIARKVANDGPIVAPKVALVGASQRICVENFANGASLCIDFSELSREQETSVVNRGSLEANNGQVILSAGGGNGVLEANDGKVLAKLAEFSGRNASLSRLGDVQAEQIVIDPTADLVIGKTVAQESGLGYDFTNPAVGQSELEWSVDEVQPEYAEGVGYGFYDAEGNGWTYMRREANTVGGVLESYSFFDPVQTYYNEGFLNNKLGEHAITLAYSRQGTTNGAITVRDGVNLVGDNDLALLAEGDLVVGNGVMRESSGGLTLQSGHDLTMGDLTTEGMLVALAENHLTSGRLTASVIALTAGGYLSMEEGADASSGRIALQGETARLGGNFTAGQEMTLSAEKVIAVSDVSLHAEAGMTVRGDWQAENQQIDLTTTQGDIQIAGRLLDAKSVSVQAGGRLMVDGIQATEKVLLEAEGSADVRGDIQGGEVLVVQAGEDVLIEPTAWVDGSEVQIQAKGGIQSQGVLAGRERIALSAGEELTTSGTLSTPLLECAGGGEILVKGTADSKVERMTIFSDGEGVPVELSWPLDLQELLVTTEGRGSIVQASVNHVASGLLVASGPGSSIQLTGGAVSLERVAAHSGDVSLEAEQTLTVGTVETEASGDVRLEAKGDVTVQERLAVAGSLKVSTGGKLVLEGQNRLVAGGSMDLTAMDFGGGHSVLNVTAGGRLYVTAWPGAEKCSFFARLEGRSSDGSLHTHGHSVPGVVFFNGRAWLGRPEQMIRIDRAESELFSRICARIHAEL